ncbi:unnamed protein product, partial [Sphenostylis stenocarpa]
MLRNSHELVKREEIRTGDLNGKFRRGGWHEKKKFWGKQFLFVDRKWEKNLDSGVALQNVVSHGGGASVLCSVFSNTL